MTWQHRLSDYYAELHRVFRRYWEEVLYDYGPETVHGFRVNLKRQVAFFHMLESLDGGRFSAREAVETFHALYRHAGKVRNRQVERSLLKKYDASVYLSQWLQDKEHRHLLVLQSLEQDQGADHLDALAGRVQQCIGSLPERDIDVRLSEYFHGLVRRMEANGDLHDLRKLIKELFYNWSFIFDDSTRDSALIWLNELQDLLGRWHDYDFTLHHLGRKRAKKDMEISRRLHSRQIALEQQIGEMVTSLPRIRERLHQILLLSRGS